MRAKPPSPAALPPEAMGGNPVRFRRGTLRLLPTGGTLRPLLTGAALLAALCGAALPYTVTLDPASPQAIYLQVGNGGFTAEYCGGTSYPPTHATPNCGPNYGGGTPQNNSTINTVSGAVAAGAVGNGGAVAMTTNSTAANSYLDGYAFCNVPSQLYIGGFYRTTGATTAAATVTATVPASLIDSAGDRIPFSKIQWTSSGNGDTGAEPFPAGTFVSGGVQTVGSMAGNSWNESCLTFAYLNNTVPAAGTYSGAVLYTMSAP
jgi:hypothetical protein